LKDKDKDLEKTKEQNSNKLLSLKHGESVEESI
jgi:hypothetical protein